MSWILVLHNLRVAVGIERIEGQYSANFLELIYLQDLLTNCKEILMLEI